MTDMKYIKKRLIDRINESEDEKLLLAVERLLAGNSEGAEIHNLSDLEKVLLLLNEKDVRYGRVISEEDLDIMDAEWMEEE